MNWFIFFSVLLICVKLLYGKKSCCNQNEEISTWRGSWAVYPNRAFWSLQTRVPMTPEFDEFSSRQQIGKSKMKKKLKRYLMPLLLAYKLKFFTLIPVLMGGLVLLTGATGLAGFFFALFAAVMGLKTGSHHN